MVQRLQRERETKAFQIFEGEAEEKRKGAVRLRGGEKREEAYVAVG